MIDDIRKTKLIASIPNTFRIRPRRPILKNSLYELKLYTIEMFKFILIINFVTL